MPWSITIIISKENFKRKILSCFHIALEIKTLTELWFILNIGKELNKSGVILYNKEFSWNSDFGAIYFMNNLKATSLGNVGEIEDNSR